MFHSILNKLFYQLLSTSRKIAIMALFLVITGGCQSSLKTESLGLTESLNLSTLSDNEKTLLANEAHFSSEAVQSRAPSEADQSEKHDDLSENCQLYQFTGAIKETTETEPAEQVIVNLSLNQGSKSEITIALPETIQNLLKTKKNSIIELITPAVKKNPFHYQAFYGPQTKFTPSTLQHYSASVKSLGPTEHCK